MKKSILSILLFIVSSTAFAQGNYKEAYIITNENDTVYGFVDFGTDYLNSMRCHFKESLSTNIISKFKPTDIKGFKYIKENKLYASKTIKISTKEEQRFVECYIQGKLSLYFLKESQLWFFLENEAGEFASLHHDRNWRNADGVKRIDNRYKETVKYILKEYPALHKDIDELEFSREGFLNLVFKYYELTESPDDYIIYYSTRPTKNSSHRFSTFIGTEYITYKAKTQLKEELFTISTFVPVVAIRYEYQNKRINNSLIGFTQASLSLINAQNENLIKSLTSKPNFHTTISIPNDTLVNVSFNSLNLNLHLGVRYMKPTGKWRPTGEISLLTSTFLNQNIKFTNKDNSPFEMLPENTNPFISLNTEKYFYIATPRHLAGINVGTGLNYFVNNKQFISFILAMQYVYSGEKTLGQPNFNSIHNNNTSLQFKIGYTF
ncbi:MAG TPA: hypothetical protein GXZ87_09590 [Bacteroidales bacterium]|nr:hypothetical protein [Bacteroidales bacterium]